MDEQRWLTYDEFAGRVGERFVLHAEGVSPREVELVEADEHAAPGGSGPHGQQRRQFSLVFRAGEGGVLPQATYRMEHAELGGLDLFLVPIGTDATGTRYEAAFG